MVAPPRRLVVDDAQSLTPSASPPSEEEEDEEWEGRMTPCEAACQEFHRSRWVPLGAALFGPGALVAGVRGGGARNVCRGVFGNVWAAVDTWAGLPPPLPPPTPAIVALLVDMLVALDALIEQFSATAATELDTAYVEAREQFLHECLAYDLAARGGPSVPNVVAELPHLAPPAPPDDYPFLLRDVFQRAPSWRRRFVADLERQRGGGGVLAFFANAVRYAPHALFRFFAEFHGDVGALVDVRKCIKESALAVPLPGQALWVLDVLVNLGMRIASLGAAAAGDTRLDVFIGNVTRYAAFVYCRYGAEAGEQFDHKECGQLCLFSLSVKLVFAEDLAPHRVEAAITTTLNSIGPGAVNETGRRALHTTMLRAVRSIYHQHERAPALTLWLSDDDEDEDDAGDDGDTDALITSAMVLC